MRLVRLIAYGLVSLAAAPTARAEILTYEMFATLTDSADPAIGGTYDEIVTLDSTAIGSTVNGTTFAFPVLSATLALNGALVAAAQNPGYRQTESDAIFTLDVGGGSGAGSPGSSVEFVFPFDFATSDPGTIQPLPDLDGRIAVSPGGQSGSGSGGAGAGKVATADASLTSIAEPPGAAALVLALGLLPALARGSAFRAQIADQGSRSSG
jgi:hypothetical protein